MLYLESFILKAGLFTTNEDINPETNEHLKELRGEGEPEIEQLRLEHFLLAFLILGVGLCLSLLFFIKEICEYLLKQQDVFLRESSCKISIHSDAKWLRYIWERHTDRHSKL